jgi:citrate lyase subunit beta/citryl-CoA lyase
MTSADLTWRSLLFVPADNQKLIDGAHTRGADALILDLEDAVPSAGKPAARKGLAAVIETLVGQGMELLVRINAEPLEQDKDLAACVRPGVRALMVPKVESTEDLRALDLRIASYELLNDLEPRSIGVIALIESPAALFRLVDLAGMPRVLGLALGSEDFSLALGVAPTAACLTLPCQWLALAAAARGVRAFGLPTSLANFRDLDALSQAAALGRAFGLHGALCIHPAQVPVVNAAFAPSEAELAWAEAVDAAWQQAEAAGSGAVKLDGAMLDKPVVQRARRLLAQRRPNQGTSS